MNDKSIYSAIFTPHIKGTLDRDISDQHVTLSFGPSEEELYKILQHSDKPIKLKIVGYGNDGKNEGLLVEILDNEIPYFNGSKNVHITLSVSEDSTPVKTGDLVFDKEIPDHIPKIIYGTIGTFTAQKGVVFDKTYVENNCFDEIEKLVKPPEEKTINITENKEID